MHNRPTQDPDNVFYKQVQALGERGNAIHLAGSKDSARYSAVSSDIYAIAPLMSARFITLWMIIENDLMPWWNVDPDADLKRRFQVMHLGHGGYGKRPWSEVEDQKSAQIEWRDNVSGEWHGLHLHVSSKRPLTTLDVLNQNGWVKYGNTIYPLMGKSWQIWSTERHLDSLSDQMLDGIIDRAVKELVGQEFRYPHIDFSGEE
jgi:hypothetical protein